MLNQDGEPNPHHHHHHHHPPHHHHHHHHHPPQGRGHPRQRRRPPSSPGQVQGHSQTQSPGSGPPKPELSERREAAPRPVHQPRPGVTRYRRHGDPNPRFRGHRPRQPIRELREASPTAEERDGPGELQGSDDPGLNQLQDRASPHQTPVAVVTPTHLSPGPVHPHPQQQAPPPPEAEEEEEELQEQKLELEEEPEKVEEEEEKVEQEQAENDGRCDDTQTVEDEEEVQKVEEDQEEEAMLDDVAAQGSEITDLCSDTESAASLSLDGPLHSPPPLQSPTPPSSPDVPPFPHLDHYSEDASLSPLPDNDLLPEDEEDEDDDDCSESCSLSQCNSSSESYPKTYADFYSESHQKSYPESYSESYSEPKQHPNSFPEPLKASYAEPQREPRRQPARRAEQPVDDTFTSHRQENVPKVAPPSPSKGSSHYARQIRDRGSALDSPAGRSVGCRLHHYDGQSDGEGDGADHSPVPKSHRQAPRHPSTQARSPPAGSSHPAETPEGTRGSGDAISLAIKDIKEAIEEVKTKTIRSPYTPDKPVEPIWVMRQEVSPTEEGGYTLQTAAGHVSIRQHQRS